MSISSAQEAYSIKFDDTDPLSTITISPSATSCTIDTSSYSYNNYSSGLTVNGLSSAQIAALSTITISTLDTSTFTFHQPVDFVDQMPSMSRIASMCDEYPGLKIAFDKFRTTYNLVKDDYDTPKDKRVKP